MRTVERCRRRRAAKGQSGVTIVELLMVIAIVAALIVPLVGWSTFAVGHLQQVDTSNNDAAAVGLLETYFSRDVARADYVGKVASEGYQNTLCLDPAGKVAVLESVRPYPGRTTAEAAKLQRTVTVYYTAQRVGFGGPEVTTGQQSLWRTQCQLADLDGAGPVLPTLVGTKLTEEIVEHIQPTVTVTCWPANTDCSSITMDFTPVKADIPVQVRARRGTARDSAVLAAGGVGDPTVTIASNPDPPVLPSADTANPYSVTFTATATPSAGRTISTYEWRIIRPDGTTASTFSNPGNVNTLTHVFTPSTHVGVHTVFVTVTDSAGATATAYRVLDPSNQAPTAKFYLQWTNRGWTKDANGRWNPPTGSATTSEINVPESGSTNTDVTIDRCTNIQIGTTFSQPSFGYYSSDPEGQLVEQPSWQIPSASQGSDNSWTFALNPNPRIAGLGPVPISLTVRDQLGSTGTATKVINVQHAPPEYPSGGPLGPVTVNGANRNVTVYFRPSDWGCGGNITNMSIWKADGSQRLEEIYRCSESVRPADETPYAGLDPKPWELEPLPCTAWNSSRWNRVDLANPSSPVLVAEPSDSNTTALPNAWYYRGVFNNGNIPPGSYKILTCTYGSATTSPPQRCSFSPNFTVS